MRWHRQVKTTQQIENQASNKVRLFGNGAVALKRQPLFLQTFEKTVINFSQAVCDVAGSEILHLFGTSVAEGYTQA